MRPRRDPHDTVIGRGSVLSGTLDIKYSVWVDGVLRGDRLATERALVVGLEGEVEAETIEVDEAIIDGRVAGTLKATREVSIGPRSYFSGKLVTPRLVIEEGAVFRDAEETKD